MANGIHGTMIVHFEFGFPDACFLGASKQVPLGFV
jgi:hypothetical protein